MTALITLLGGIRATVFAGIALLAMIAVGVQSVRLGQAWAENDRMRADVAEANEELANARLAASESARALEQEKAKRSNAVAAAYEKGKRDAEATGNRVAADLRAGNVRLREHWRGCETARLSAAAGAAGQLDAGADLRAADTGRLVGTGAACDAQVRGLQDFVRVLTR